MALRNLARAQACNQACQLHNNFAGALDDERHFVLECPAMQSVRDRYPALFHVSKSTMQLFMWQADIVGVAHYIMDCFDHIAAAFDADDDDSHSSSSALAAG
jgi:hypothetical protein